MEDGYHRYIVTLDYKIPYEERDIAHSLSRIDETFRSAKDREVGEPVTWSVEATPEEVERMRAASNVTAIEPDVPMMKRQVPDASEYAFHKIDQADLWGFDGRGIVVGVIDEAVNQNLFSMHMFKRSPADWATTATAAPHGTNVSSLAIPPASKLAFFAAPLLRSTFVEGVYWLADQAGAHAIVYSAGSFTPSDQAEKDAIKHARRTKNVPVFAAIGNDGGTQMEYPACEQNALAIGPADKSIDNKWSQANQGGYEWAFASGTEVLVKTPSGGTESAYGSSLATPLAAYMYARLMSKIPNKTASEQVLDTMWKTRRGVGILQFEEAVGKATGKNPQQPGKPPGLCR